MAAIKLRTLPPFLLDCVGYLCVIVSLCQRSVSPPPPAPRVSASTHTYVPTLSLTFRTAKSSVRTHRRPANAQLPVLLLSLEAPEYFGGLNVKRLSPQMKVARKANLMDLLLLWRRTDLSALAAFLLCPSHYRFY